MVTLADAGDSRAKTCICKFAMRGIAYRRDGNGIWGL